MTIFTLGGILSFLAHHFFYDFLDGRSVADDTVFVLQARLHRDEVDSQAFTNTIGNAIATVAKICFAGAAATAFTQLFWWQLRRRAGTIEQINGVLSFRASPFVPTSWMAWASFPTLSAIAFAAVPLIAITVAAPGSLTVVGADIPQDCIIPTVDLSESLLYSLADPDNNVLFNAAPTSETYQLVAAVMMAGTFLTPFPPSANGTVVGYNTTFAAPTLVCTDITDSYDFDHLLPYIRIENNVPTSTVWNAAYNYEDENTIFDLAVARRGLGQVFLSDVNSNTSQGQHDALEAVSCTPYDATYVVNAIDDLFEDASFLDVTSLTLGSSYKDISAIIRNDSNAQQHFTLYDALARTLSSTVSVKVYRNTTAVIGNKFVAYSKLSVTSDTDPWAWDGTLMDTLPLLMQHISLSLLSGSPVTHGEVETVRMVESTCLISGLWFHYNRVRLLATYLVTGGCAIAVVVLGFLAVHENGGQGETLDFSRILGSGLELREKIASAGGVAADVSLQTIVKTANQPFAALNPGYRY